ncbi:hypothetical protein Q3G72_018374 [Acer saccharum]|nr:hypothetical protein Q3G72_018374 [Acer saccharum]
MVSQRQRLARKQYKEAHPELFPKVEPTPPKDPDKKKKKKSSFKRKRDPRDLNRPIKRSFTKHPLRVPGMKPGESCFICKAKEHIAKHCPEKAQWEKNKICLLCRHRGHSLKNCPNKKDEEVVGNKLCYNCGETGHSLSQCPLPLRDGGTKFASCFICKEQGHISKNCPKNTHGIYPKGGCCNICGGVTHLARDCPNKANASRQGPQAMRFDELPRGKVTKFTGGDDLDDDFMTEVAHSVNNDKSSVSKDVPISESDPKEVIVKSKKKQGPKVVNFVG